MPEKPKRLFQQADQTIVSWKVWPRRDAELSRFGRIARGSTNELEYFVLVGPGSFTPEHQFKMITHFSQRRENVFSQGGNLLARRFHIRHQDRMHPSGMSRKNSGFGVFQDEAV